MWQLIVFISISNFKLHCNSLSLSLNKFPTSFPRLKFSSLLWMLFCLIPWYSACLVISCLLFLRFLSTISTNFLKSKYEQAVCLPLKMWFYLLFKLLPHPSLFFTKQPCRQCSLGHYSPPCNHSAFFISSISIFELLLSSIVPETGGTSKNQFLFQKPSLVRDKLINWNVSSHVPYFYKVMQTVHLHHSPQTTFRTVINVYLLIANLRNLFSVLILLACSSGISLPGTSLLPFHLHPHSLLDLLFIWPLLFHCLLCLFLFLKYQYSMEFCLWPYHIFKPHIYLLP